MRHTRAPKMVINFSSSVPHFSSPAWNSACNEPPCVSQSLFWFPKHSVPSWTVILPACVPSYWVTYKAQKWHRSSCFQNVGRNSPSSRRCRGLREFLPSRFWTLVYRQESNSAKSFLVLFCSSYSCCQVYSAWQKANSIIPVYISDVSRVSYRTPRYTATQFMVKRLTLQESTVVGVYRALILLKPPEYPYLLLT